VKPHLHKIPGDDLVTGFRLLVDVDRLAYLILRLCAINLGGSRMTGGAGVSNLNGKMGQTLVCHGADLFTFDHFSLSMFIGLNDADVSEGHPQTKKKQ
jgi:hypothetical protein